MAYIVILNLLSIVQRFFARRTFIPDSIRRNVGRDAANHVSSMRINNEVAFAGLQGITKDIRLYKIEWHRKIALSMSCLVMFLIGAPLGSIIRKGGVGTPLIFAIIFFMIFYS